MFVDDGGKSWAVVSVFVVMGSTLAFVAAGDQLTDAAASAAARSPALGSLLGWLPVGGCATYVAALVLWRGRPRLATGLALVWAGLGLAFLPLGRSSGMDRWERLTSAPGPDFEQAAQWCFGWLLVTAAFGFVLGLLLIRSTRATSAADFAPYVRRWVAASLAVPYLALLVGLVVA